MNPLLEWLCIIVVALFFVVQFVIPLILFLVFTWLSWKADVHKLREDEQ
jgi:hypothetical protein